MSYNIVRFYRDRGMANQVIESGLTLEQAQAHCQDKETASKTCTKPDLKTRTRKYGPWFDGYTEA